MQSVLTDRTYMHIKQILNKPEFDRKDIIRLLQVEKEDKTLLFEKAAAVKREYVEDKVYFRGLIEFSNICRKNCFYCGIRQENQQITRYNLEDHEILDAARVAYENNFGSVVLQSGETVSPEFTNRVSKFRGNGQPGIYKQG